MIAADTVERPRHEPAPEGEAAAPAPGSVLVVDDMASIRAILSQQVARLGHQVAPAANGREALEQLRAGRFDLVLLDVMMPEMDGYAVLEAMKADPELRNVPVIVVSGVDELESVVRCIERGAEDYLHKPCNPTLLRARVGSCLEKKRLWDELQAKYRQLQELERLRDSLTHMVVHDLRPPLTVVLSGLREVGDRGPLNEAQQEFWQMALQGGRTLLAMINDLLDISKMEDGSLRLDYQAVDPHRLAEQAVRQVSPLAKEKQQALAIDVAPDLPSLIADEAHLCRILVNLIGNAVKFTPCEGRIVMAARVSEVD